MELIKRNAGLMAGGERGFFARYVDADKSDAFTVPVTESMLARPPQVFKQGDGLHYDGAFLVDAPENEELSDDKGVSAIPKHEDYMRQYFQTVNDNPIKKERDNGTVARCR